MKSGIIAMSLFLGILLTCCEDEPAGGKPPVISLDNQEASYSVKAGRQITIAPEYENVEDAVFAWKLDGNIISTEPSLTFSSVETGTYYVELTVINGYGTAYSEVQISVMELVVPKISLAFPQDGYATVENGTLLLEPIIENGEGATFAWYVNGTETASTQEFSFVAEKAGTYTLKFVASSEDGSSEIEFDVKVYTAEQMPFSWDFEYETFNVSAGRTIRIKAFGIYMEGRRERGPARKFYRVSLYSSCGLRGKGRERYGCFRHHEKSVCGGNQRIEDKQLPGRRNIQESGNRCK